MKSMIWALLSVLAIFVFGISMLNIFEPEYAYFPPSEKTLNDQMSVQSVQTEGYDVWGTTISKEESKTIHTKGDHSTPSPRNGAVHINDSLLQLGRKTFYQETFGNEVFMTDIAGIVDGAFTIPNIAKAIVSLRGEGTTNLQVELAKTVTIAGRTFNKGSMIDTGIDVPRGAYTPLGLPIKYADGRLRVGISCAACHATVDRETKMVIEGAPNTDFNAGLLLALATNSTAYLTHAEIGNIKKYMDSLDRTVVTTDGKKASLPNPIAIEEAVDSTFLKWSPGNFDSTIDMKANPAQIPDSFTLGDHPYGWSGFAAAGPFKGLSVFSNNVHAQNSDSLSQADVSHVLFGMDKEVYLGTILQNSANPKFRYKVNSIIKPSDFFASVDPTPGVPGVNEMIKPPTFPKLTLVAPDGLFLSSPGYRFGEQVNSMAAWQNTIAPPKQPEKVDTKTVALGQEVFSRAGCIACHAGDALTNNQVIPVNVIKTEPSRAKALKKTEKLFTEAVLYGFDTPVPLPENATPLKVPTQHLDREQIKLAFAHGDSQGGYKVPSLIGLYWTAPYLHDGGVAVGPDPATQLGIQGTLMKGIYPDPANSLRALVDKELRQKVIAANKSSKDLQFTHVSGIGHEYWVDSTTQFTKEEQEALIKYLLSVGSDLKQSK